MSVAATIAVHAPGTGDIARLPLFNGPKGPVLPWRAYHSVAGDVSAGSVTITLQFNANGGARESAYAITNALAAVAGAAPTSGVLLSPVNFLQGPVAHRGVPEGAASYRAARLIDPSRPLYLGRVEAGTTGDLDVFFDTNHGATYSYLIELRGLYCPNGDFVFSTGVVV